MNYREGSPVIGACVDQRNNTSVKQKELIVLLAASMLLNKREENKRVIPGLWAK